MAPPKRERYSMKTYAGKRRVKQSLSYVPEADPFDMLCQDKKTKSNIFESSSERENSAHSRTPVRPVEMSSSPKNQNTSCYSPSLSIHQGISRGSGRIHKSSKKAPLSNLEKVIKKIDKSDVVNFVMSSDQLAIKSSTPKLQNIGRRLRKHLCPQSSSYLKSSGVSSPLSRISGDEDMISVAKLSPIIKNDSFVDSCVPKVSTDKTAGNDSTTEDLCATFNLSLDGIFLRKDKCKYSVDFTKDCEEPNNSEETTDASSKESQLESSVNFPCMVSPKVMCRSESSTVTSNSSPSLSENITPKRDEGVDSDNILNNQRYLQRLREDNANGNNLSSNKLGASINENSADDLLVSINNTTESVFEKESSVSCEYLSTSDLSPSIKKDSFLDTGQENVSANCSDKSVSSYSSLDNVILKNINLKDSQKDNFKTSMLFDSSDDGFPADYRLSKSLTNLTSPLNESLCHNNPVKVDKIHPLNSDSEGSVHSKDKFVEQKTSSIDSVTSVKEPPRVRRSERLRIIRNRTYNDNLDSDESSKGSQSESDRFHIKRLDHLVEDFSYSESNSSTNQIKISIEEKSEQSAEDSSSDVANETKPVDEVMARLSIVEPAFTPTRITVRKRRN